MDAHVEAQLAPSRALAEFAANLRHGDIPPRMPELAKVACVADPDTTLAFSDAKVAHLERLVLRPDDTSVRACAGGQS